MPEKNEKIQEFRPKDETRKRIISTAYSQAKEVLTLYRAKLDALAELLIRDETIEGPEFEAMFSDVPAPQRPTKPAPKPEQPARSREEPDAPRLAPMPAPSPA